MLFFSISTGCDHCSFSLIQESRFFSNSNMTDHHAESVQCFLKNSGSFLIRRYWKHKSLASIATIFFTFHIWAIISQIGQDSIQPTKKINKLWENVDFGKFYMSHSWSFNWNSPGGHSPLRDIGNRPWAKVLVQGAGPDLTTATNTIHKTSKPLVSMLVGFQVVNVKVLTFLIYSSMTIYLGICDDCDLTFLIRWLSPRRASA